MIRRPDLAVFFFAPVYFIPRISPCAPTRVFCRKVTVARTKIFSAPVLYMVRMIITRSLVQKYILRYDSHTPTPLPNIFIIAICTLARIRVLGGLTLPGRLVATADDSYKNILRSLLKIYTLQARYKQNTL